MAPGFAALTVGVLVSLCLQIHGERLSQPLSIRFVADIMHHVVHWEPGVNHSRDTLYDVEYMLYAKTSWLAAPDCTGISGHSCNLTYQTMDPSQRYYARVRAVSGNHTSRWTRTNVFSPREATLRLPDVTMSVKGNTIHVRLHLLLSVGNKTVAYKDIQKFSRQYRTYVRRVSDNVQQVQVETSEEFDIPTLLWGEQYCVSIEPQVLSRPIPSIPTKEKCLSIPEEDRTAIIAVGVSIFLFVVSVSALLGTLLLCAYIKKPVRTPSILKSLIKPSWAEEEHFPGAQDMAVCLDEELIQQFSFCQKDPVHHGSADSGSCPAQQPADEGWVFLTSPDGHGRLWEREALAGSDRSCNSTDSGICLQGSSSGLSQFSGSESQGYKRQLPAGEDSGVGLARRSLGLTHSSSSRDYSSVDEGQEQREGEGESPPLAGGSSPEAVEFRGYLKQPKEAVERQQDRAEGLQRTQSAAGPGAVLELGCPEPALAQGYLKQASPALPCSNAGAHTGLTDAAPTGESDLLGFTSRFECRAWSWLSSRALGISGTTSPPPELPKAPFALGLFHTELPASLPLISSLQPHQQLRLGRDALSLLGAECKDSRL